MPNTPPCGSGKSRLDAQTYRASLLCLGKNTANKRSNGMPQDSGNDAMSCEPSYKRQRVGLATQESERYICSSDGVMAPSQASFSIPKSTVDASHDQSLSVVQDSSKSPSADSNNPRFAEYWVPVQLTDVQVEQYCSTILTYTELLCSSKKPNLDLLQDVLWALRKCCDHPYVVEPNLARYRIECCPLVDHLSIGIQASGKLQLLSKLLPKIREQGLRVVIVYKTTSSPVKIGLGIGDILDDFICRSFGQESYNHCYARYNPSKGKKAAVDPFGDRTSRTFVVLAEYSSCPVSMRLASSDVVILFNSDLNPTIDIRSLKKMSVYNGQLRVLRLYSLFTVEEKALCMARDSSAVHRNKQYISTSTCQKLVSWGATCLFEKLDAIHASNIPESNKSEEDEFLCSVLHELSTILSSNVDHSSISCLVISKAIEVGEDGYGNIELHGELHVQSPDDVPPHVIWSSLLQGRIPWWLFLPNDPGYLKKRISFWERPPEMSQGFLHDEIPSWHRDTNHNAKRSKRVRRCILGFQQKLQEMKKLWYNKVDKSLRKRKPEDKNGQETQFLISEMCGASYRKLGRFKLDDEIQLGGVCNDMDNWVENLYPALLTPRNSEEEIDAPSTSIDSRALNTSESASGTLEQSMRKTSCGDEMNTANGSNLLCDAEVSTESLPTESSSMCQTLQEGTLNNNQPISDDHDLKRSEQPTSNLFVLQEDLDIFDECLPTKEMVVAIGSDSDNIYVRSVAVPVAELSDPIPLEDLIASDCILKEDENHAPQNAVSGSLSVTENQGPIIGMQSSEELAIQSDAVKVFPDTLYEETLLDNEQIELQQSTDQICKLPSEQLPPTPLPCSDFTVTVPSPSCEIVKNDACSPPLQLPAGGSLRPDASGQLDSTVRDTEGDAQPLLSNSYGNEHPNSNEVASLDPLQSELERIQNVGNVERKKHEDTVFQLKAARDKEIEQINQRYALLYHNVQKDFIQKKEELKMCYENTKAHKALAEAWKLATDENIPISVPAPLVQINGTQRNMQPPFSLSVNRFSNSSPNQTVLPPYPPSFQNNLYNSEAGCGPYIPNPYLYPSPLTQTNQLHRYPVSQPNHHPLNLSLPTLSAATAYPQLYSSLEYLAHYNIHI